MTGAEAIALLKQRCARFSGTSIDTYVLDELKAAQTRLEHEPEPFWFCLETDAWRYLVLDEDRVPIPDDFLIEYPDDSLWVRETSAATKRYPLVKMGRDRMEDAYPLYGNRPKAYSLVGDVFFIRPLIENMTASTWLVEMMYYRSQDVIADDATTNGWLTHCPDLLISEAGLWIANNYLKNTSAAQMFQATITSERNRLHDFATARDEANNERYEED